MDAELGAFAQGRNESQAFIELCIEFADVLAKLDAEWGFIWPLIEADKGAKFVVIYAAEVLLSIHIYGFGL